MNPRKCTICGQEYTPTAYNQTRCKSCVDARKMRCKICGAIYTAEAYNRPGNRARCPACLSAFRAQLNTAKARPQSDAARAKAFAAKSAAGTVNIRSALSVRETHPRTATGSHAHAHAKIWFLKAPDGSLYEVQNLNAFIAERPEVFPNVAQAKKLFHAISRTLREPDGNFPHRYSYYGWTMTAPPMVPKDIAEAKAYREAVERHRIERRQKDTTPPTPKE